MKSFGFATSLVGKREKSFLFFFCAVGDFRCSVGRFRTRSVEGEPYQLRVYDPISKSHGDSRCSSFFFVSGDQVQLFFVNGESWAKRGLGKCGNAGKLRRAP